MQLDLGSWPMRCGSPHAVKFAPPRSTVTLRAYEQGGLVLIEVEDQCGGLGEHIPAELCRP